MSSAPQENVEVLSGLSDESGHRVYSIRGSPLGLENLCSHEKGDRTDKAGEDHSPCDVHRDHDEEPVSAQCVVGQLIGLDDQTKQGDPSLEHLMRPWDQSGRHGGVLARNGPVRGQRVFPQPSQYL